MRQTVFEGKACYCINFRRAANALTRFYDQALAPLNLTGAQYSLLNDINALESCNKSELAKYARLDRTTIIRNVKVLREKGFIREKPEAVSLTPAGAAAIIEGRAGWKLAQREVKRVIGEENIPVLRQILANIAAWDRP